MNLRVACKSQEFCDCLYILREATTYPELADSGPYYHRSDISHVLYLNTKKPICTSVILNRDSQAPAAMSEKIYFSITEVHKNG